MSEPTTHPVCDENGLELSPRVVRIAIRWLIWQHGMTVEEAAKTMTQRPGGNTRQRQRQEAIDVADFVEHGNHEPEKSDAEHIRDILKSVEHFR